MGASSPAKRRVLAPVDPNASTSPSLMQVCVGGKQAAAGRLPLKKQTQRPHFLGDFRAGGTSLSPSRLTKRSSMQLQSNKGPARKKLCVSGSRDGAEMLPQKRPQSQMSDQDQKPELLRDASLSPSVASTVGASSASALSSNGNVDLVFDSSILAHGDGNTSHNTTLSELDIAAPGSRLSSAASLPRMTREQARQKAEILRLRLSLANYKLRTGQTDVPLERLEEQMQQRLARSAPAAFLTTMATHLTSRRPLPTTRRPSEEDIIETQRNPSHLAEGAAVMEVSQQGQGPVAVLVPQSQQQQQQQHEGRLERAEQVIFTTRQVAESAAGEDDRIRNGKNGVVDDQDQNDSPQQEKTCMVNNEKELTRQPHPNDIAAVAEPGANFTPRRRIVEEEERLTSNARRGGAASGLLSLSRG